MSGWVKAALLVVGAWIVIANLGDSDDVAKAPGSPSIQSKSATWRDELVSANIPSPELIIENWSCSRTYDYVEFEGQVRNVSGQPISNVVAVGSIFMADGNTFIGSSDALIDFDPLLPNQASPFKVLVRYNPAFQRCNIRFKRLFGGELHATTKNRLNESLRDVTTDVQRRLSQLGYPMVADGVIGPKTKEAIKKFQHDKGFPVDGEVTLDLLRQIKWVEKSARLEP